MALLGHGASGLYSPWEAQGSFSLHGLFLGHQPGGKMSNGSSPARIPHRGLKAERYRSDRMHLPSAPSALAAK